MSLATAATFGATLVVLGIVGWTAGWLAAGPGEQDLGQGQPSHSPSVVTSPTPKPSLSPTLKPTSTPSPAPLRTDAFPMPDLIGEHFQKARQEAASLRLGVEVRFGEPANRPDGTVVRTDPDPKDLVYPGLTIFLYVAGEAPVVEVPDLTGQPCHEGKDALIQAGLKIDSYPSGEKGLVQWTDPPAGTRVKWNDRVKLFCAERAP